MFNYPTNESPCNYFYDNMYVVSTSPYTLHTAIKLLTTNCLCMKKLPCVQNNTEIFLTSHNPARIIILLLLTLVSHLLLYLYGLTLTSSLPISPVYPTMKHPFFAALNAWNFSAGVDILFKL